MTDIVQRLRARKATWQEAIIVMEQAADEIERWKQIAMRAEEDANAMAREARVKEMSESTKWDAALVALERNATIERCAQVADSMKPFGYDIAKAIRALKDK